MAKDATKTYYQAVIDVQDVTLGAVDDLLTMLREHGSATIDWQKATVMVTWEVGPDGCVVDLWDLRDVVNEVEDRLSVWIDGSPKVPKPREATNE